jgi:hypothetical protein
MPRAPTTSSSAFQNPMAQSPTAISGGTESLRATLMSTRSSRQLWALSPHTDMEADERSHHISSAGICTSLEALFLRGDAARIKSAADKCRNAVTYQRARTRQP